LPGKGNKGTAHVIIIWGLGVTREVERTRSNNFKGHQ